jgi:DNA polymerase III sliding clamp (beta) subunit (PCNA family)
MVTVNRMQLLNAVWKSLISKNKIFTSERDNKVLLKASDNILKVYSTNYEVYDTNDRHYDLYHNYLSISIEISESSNSELIALVDRYNLLNILKSIKSNEVSLSIQKDGSTNYLVISNNILTYRLQCYNHESFIDDIMNKNINDGIIINSDTLINAIDKVMYTVYKAGIAYTTINENYNPNIFKGIGFIFENNSFFIAGTDNYRLAICDLQLPNNLNTRFVITKKAAFTLKKIFNFNNSVLFNIVEEGGYKRAVFKTNNIVFITDIIKEYPDIFGTINKDLEHIVMVLKLSKKAKEAMISTLKSFIPERKENIDEKENKKEENKEGQEEENNNNKVKLIDFSKPRIIIVKLTLENNNLHILSLFDNDENNIRINYKGNKYEIMLNALFLLEALENMCSDNIVLKLPSNEKCGMYIEPTGKCNCLALVMPMEVKYYDFSKT